mmetsp:Transcript_67373/g.101580  ORF Transcript_67373/g.101580 Transcript_67373/m.101580 type:complete len:215 (+) Transcript_67373:617-1261(+)
MCRIVYIVLGKDDTLCMHGHTARNKVRYRRVPTDVKASVIRHALNGPSIHMNRPQRRSRITRTIVNRHDKSLVLQERHFSKHVNAFLGIPHSVNDIVTSIHTNVHYVIVTPRYDVDSFGMFPYSRSGVDPSNVPFPLFGGAGAVGRRSKGVAIPIRRPCHQQNVIVGTGGTKNRFQRCHHGRTGTQFQSRNELLFQRRRIEFDNFDVVIDVDIR